MSTTTAPPPAKQQETAKPTTSALVFMRDRLEKAKDKLAEVAPKYVNADRLIRLLLAACARPPKDGQPGILDCTPESALLFAMKCAETGMELIGPGGAWPIPFKNSKKGTVELTFVPDYRGLVNSAKRAECITDCRAEIVREADEFEYELGTDPRLTHKPARRDRGKIEAAYAVCTMPDGSKRFTVMEADEIQSIRKRSKASGFGPWVTDEGEMTKKTVIRRAMKAYQGMSPVLDAGLEAFDEVEGVNTEAREDVPMPKAIGETSANGNGKHEETAKTVEPVADVENEAAEQEAAERLNRVNQLLADLTLARQTWVAQCKKEYGGRTWDDLTADEQVKEIVRLEGKLPVEK